MKKRNETLLLASGTAAGFTLVELLVVIGIIGLLISILLPALTKARRSELTVTCAANLRSILQGMTMYAGAYNDYIVGSPNSSGAFAFNSTGFATNYSNTYCPEVSQIWDWQAPIAKLQGITFNEAGDPASRVQRFHFLNDLPQFTCPENQFVATEYSSDNMWNSSNMQTDAMPSYVTAMQFLYLPEPKGLSTSSPLLGTKYTNASYIILPTGYTPKVTRVGPPSRKIFIADGGKFSEPSAAPNYVIAYDAGGTVGGAYSDYGSFDYYSRALNRTAASGGFKPPQFDSRIYAFRHGILVMYGPTNYYRFNAGFYDGHVETMGDLEGADPSFWNPTGSIVYVTEVTGTSAPVLHDVFNTYLGSKFSPIMFTVP